MCGSLSSSETTRERASESRRLSARYYDLLGEGRWDDRVMRDALQWATSGARRVVCRREAHSAKDDDLLPT